MTETSNATEQNNTEHVATEEKTIISEAISDTSSSNKEQVEDKKESDKTVETKIENDKKETTETKDNSVIEKYTGFKLPEGLTFDTEKLTEFSTVAKELKLSQEQAQKLVDFQSSYVLQQKEKALSEYQTQVNQWKEETKKVLGNNLEKDLVLVAKVRDRYGSSNLTKLLDDSGLGNHPEIIKFFVNVGKIVSEDSLDVGKNKTVESKTIAERLYS